MSFGTPLGLLALALAPLALLAHLAVQRRARRYAIRFPAAVALQRAAGVVPAWRRHLPALLLALSLAFLAVALARPRHTVRVPVERASIVLVSDHSGSMQATDVDPSRMAAAQAAAARFIDQVPDAVRIGAVAFADAPDDVQAPSGDHDAARSVIADQAARGATATGDALLTALDLLRAPAGRPRAPSAIVLLSDGATTVGSDPLAAARRARSAGIPIYTVALGTADATIPNPNGFGQISVAPDFETLREISSTTRGTAYTASDADRLGEIYRTLGSRLGTRAETREISAAFAVGGLLLLLGAAGLSGRSISRLP